MKTFFVWMAGFCLLLGCSTKDTNSTNETHTSHDHSHDSKAEATHGGSLVAVGHTHGEQIRQYFAEVVHRNDQVELYFLVDTGTTVEALTPGASEISGMIQLNEGTTRELDFQLDGDKLHATLPSETFDEHFGANEKLVVIPSIRLEKIRFKVQFSIHPPSQETPPKP